MQTGISCSEAPTFTLSMWSLGPDSRAGSQANHPASWKGMSVKAESRREECHRLRVPGRAGFLYSRFERLPSGDRVKINNCHPCRHSCTAGRVFEMECSERAARGSRAVDRAKGSPKPPLVVQWQHCVCIDSVRSRVHDRIEGFIEAMARRGRRLGSAEEH